MTFGQRVKSLRELHHFSIWEAAEETLVNAVSWKNIEDGYNCSLLEIREIARAFSISIEELMRDVD